MRKILHLQVAHRPVFEQFSIVEFEELPDAAQMKHFGYFVSDSSKYGARVVLLVVDTFVDSVVLRVVGFVVFGVGRVFRLSSFMTSILETLAAGYLLIKESFLRS